MNAPIHICLVSAQLMPNLMPILHYGAKEVYLVTTSDMKGQGGRFEAMLNWRGIQTTIKSSAPSASLAKIMDYATAFANELATKHDSSNVVLNMTGGTKLMVVGFIFAFENVFENVKIIYTDTENRLFDLLENNEYSSEAIPANLVDVATYLEAHACKNIKVTSDDAAWRERVENPDRERLTTYLAKNIKDIGQNFFSSLNESVQKGFEFNPKNKRTEFLSNKELAKPKFDEANPFAQWVWDEMANVGLTIKVGNKFRFADEQSANYAGGFWLEEYAWLVGSRLKLADFKVGVSFWWHTEGGRAKNELDVVAIHNNRPLFIECKTVRYTKHEKGQEIIYKLDSLTQRFARVVGDKMLLSALPLDFPAKERSAATGIEVIEGSGVGGLESRLKRLLK